MGNKLCKDCFRPRYRSEEDPSKSQNLPKIAPGEHEFQNFVGSVPEIGSKKILTSYDSIPNPKQLPIEASGVFIEVSFNDIELLIEAVPFVLENPLSVTMLRSVKKKPPLKLTIFKEKRAKAQKTVPTKEEKKARRESQALPIPEERDSGEELQIPKNIKISTKTKETKKKKKLTVGVDRYKGSPAETSSAIQNLKRYTLDPNLDHEILLLANNVVLEEVESLWALNQDSIYSHINLIEYEVFDMKADKSFILQHKVSLLHYRINTVIILPENPINLGSLYSQGSILEKIQKVKFYNKFACKIQSMYTIEASQKFPRPFFGFQAVKLQEYGICSLQELLDKGVNFSPSQVVYFLKNMAGLAAKSEAMGIANRKLIPSNFILAENLIDFKVHDYSLACNLGAEKTTSLPSWAKEFEDFWPPEINETLASGLEQRRGYNPFQADIYTLALSCLVMMGVKREELAMLKANELALEKKLGVLSSEGHQETVNQLRAMLNIKPDHRLSFNEVLENLKSHGKLKTHAVAIKPLEAKPKQESNAEFFERFGDLINLITGEGESLGAYEEALRLVQLGLIQGEESFATQIRIYEKITRIYYSNGFFGKAAQAYMSLIELQKKRLNEEKTIETILNMIVMAQIKTEEKNYNLAGNLLIDAYRECMEYYNGKSEYLEYAFIYKNIGEMLIRIPKYQEIGIKYFYRAIEIIQKVEGMKSQLYFIYLDCLAEAYETVGASLNTSEIYHRIVDEGRIIFGKVHPLLSKMYLKLSYAYYDQEQFLKAQHYYKKGLFLQIKIFGENSIEVAVTKLQLAKSFLQTNDWKKSLRLLNESLDVTKKIMGEGTREVALVLNALGLAYAEKPDNSKALEYYMKAYETLKEIHKKDVSIYLEISRCMEDIGNLYAKQKEKIKALSYYYQGLLAKKDVYGESSSEVGLAYERIGDVTLDFDDRNSALEAYKNALDIFMKNEAKDFFGCIRLLDHIGKMTVFQGESESDATKEKEYFQKAVDYFMKCAELQEKYLNDKSEIELDWKKSVLTYIGNLYFNHLQYDEALNYMQKALDLLAKVYKNPTEDTSDILQNIATIHYKKGEQIQALEAMQKVYDIRLNMFGKSDRSVAQAISMIIKIYKGLNDKENSERWEKVLGETLKSVNVSEEEMKTGLINFDRKEKKIQIVRRGII